MDLSLAPTQFDLDRVAIEAPGERPAKRRGDVLGFDHQAGALDNRGVGAIQWPPCDAVGIGDAGQHARFQRQVPSRRGRLYNRRIGFGAGLGKKVAKPDRGVVDGHLPVQLRRAEGGVGPQHEGGKGHGRHGAGGDCSCGIFAVHGQPRSVDWLFASSRRPIE